MIKKVLSSALIAALLFVTSSCVKEITDDPDEDTIYKGTLILSSNPSGAYIFVNNKNSGQTTPDTIKYLAPGNYKITLKIPYFRDTTISVNIGVDEAKNQFMDFLKVPSMLGSLFISSDPTNSLVWLNDSSTEKYTPVKIDNIKPGIYTVRVSKVNYRDMTTQFTVQSGQINNISMKLRDTSKWVDYTKMTSAIPSNFLTCIIADNNNVKWIGSQDSGLIRFDEGVFLNYKTSNSPIPSNNILSLAVDNQNRILIGTDNGLAILDNSVWTIYNSSNSALKTNRINSIVCDNQEIKWIGTPSGLNKFYNGVFTPYDTLIDNKPIMVNDIAIKDGMIYLATEQTGIAVFNNNHFERFILPSNSCLFGEKVTKLGYVGNDLYSILPMQNSFRTAINVYTNTNCNNLQVGSNEIVIENFFVDKNQFVWISTNEGVYKMKSRSIVTQYYKSNSLINSNAIKDIFVDANNVVWITTSGSGLAKFKDN